MTNLSPVSILGHRIEEEIGERGNVRTKRLLKEAAAPFPEETGEFVASIPVAGKESSGALKDTEKPSEIQPISPCGNVGLSAGKESDGSSGAEDDWAFRAWDGVGVSSSSNFFDVGVAEVVAQLLLLAATDAEDDPVWLHVIDDFFEFLVLKVCVGFVKGSEIPMTLGGGESAVLEEVIDAFLFRLAGDDPEGVSLMKGNGTLFLFAHEALEDLKARNAGEIATEAHAKNERDVTAIDNCPIGTLVGLCKQGIVPHHGE